MHGAWPAATVETTIENEANLIDDARQISNKFVDFATGTSGSPTK